MGTLAIYQEGYTDGFDDAKKKYCHTAKWNSTKLGTSHYVYRCSDCDFKAPRKYYFCPNCGADMRGKE